MENQKTVKLEDQLTGSQKGFIERETICPLCSGKLAIKVKSYLGNFAIAEEAYCASCDVVTRTKDHKIH